MRNKIKKHIPKSKISHIHTENSNYPGSNENKTPMEHSKTCYQSTSLLKNKTKNILKINQKKSRKERGKNKVIPQTIQQTHSLKKRDNKSIPNLQVKKQERSVTSDDEEFKRTLT